MLPLNLYKFCEAVIINSESPAAIISLIWILFNSGMKGVQAPPLKEERPFEVAAIKVLLKLITFTILSDGNPLAVLYIFHDSGADRFVVPGF
jgi:hypothetical protein